MFYRCPASNLQLYNQDPCHDHITLIRGGTIISLLELQEPAFNLPFPPIIMGHKGRTSFATPSLDCYVSHSLKYTNFLPSGAPQPIPAFILFELGCVYSPCIWNVSKEGLAGEVEEGTEASSRDCAG